MIPYIKISSTNEDIIDRIYIQKLIDGWILIKAYSKRTFPIFGVKKFYIEMEAGEWAMEDQLRMAIENERYEDAAKIKRDLDELKSQLV